MNRKALSVVFTLVVVSLSVVLAGCGTPQERTFSNLKGAWHEDESGLALEFVTPTDFTVITSAGSTDAKSGTYEITDESHVRMTATSLPGTWGGFFNSLATIERVDGERLVLKPTSGKARVFLRDKSATKWAAEGAKKAALQSEGDGFAQALEQGVDWDALGATQNLVDGKPWPGAYHAVRLVEGSVGKAGDGGLKAEVEWLLCDQRAADNPSTWTDSGKVEDLFGATTALESNMQALSGKVEVFKRVDGKSNLPGGYWIEGGRWLMDYIKQK